jgi:AraC family transcriptional activator of mtrCDE
VVKRQISRISAIDLDNLMTGLEVDLLRLAECLISPAWGLSYVAAETPTIHYNLSGVGKLTIGDFAPISLAPHTLVIVPPRQSFTIEAGDEFLRRPTFQVVEANDLRAQESKTLHRHVAGDGEPQVILICGYFRATYGASTDLFAALTSPIVEQFDASDQLDGTLKTALSELVAQEVGMGAMTAALLKQVLITLLRRSLSSVNVWAERFAMLSDPQIARAFSEMVARPGAPHSIQSLSNIAGLSRSGFMTRFVQIIGDSPMAVLRQLRMRRALMLLTAGTLSVDQIARGVGYTNRSSFLRAFRRIYGVDPADHHSVELDSSELQPLDVG